MADERKRDLKILIVEDDIVDAKLLKRQLTQTSLNITRVVHTERLEESLTTLAQEQFDIVLLDMNLPDSNGMDTLQRLHKSAPEVTIINVTGSTDEEMGLMAVANGAQDYLVKGRFDPYVLNKSIQYSIERKKVEEALRESTGKLDAMLSSISDDMTMLDRDLTIIWANPSAKQKFGEEMVGKKCYQVYHDNTECCPKSDCALKKAFETGTVQRWDSAITDIKGNTRCFHSTANVAIRDSEEKPQAVLQVSRDVTEEKNAENALLKANKELENANRGLKQMQGQLVQSEKLASIGQLAAGVAHEMNTPVGFVASNFVTLRSYVKKFKTLMEMYNALIKEMQSKDASIFTEKITEIEKSWKSMKIDFICGDIECLFDESKEGLERITSIIQNLRDFSRIDQAENLAEYDLNSGIKATLIVARNAIKYDAEIKTDFCESLPVFCNSGQINQVFLNILVNAAQAIKSQQKEEKGFIEIKTYAEGDWAICAIRDNGPGMPPEIMSKIFDPFFTTKAVGKGTGLGLSVSHDIIVNKHKGLIEIQSEVGKGTTFFIKLPLKNLQQENNDKVLAETGANGK